MSFIIGEGVGKSYGANEVFKNLTFEIPPDGRIGLVGPNGAGKTTLLRILAGQDQATFGAVRTKKGLRAGYLPQDAPNLGQMTLWDSMLEIFAGLRALENDIHDVSAQLAERPKDEALLEKLGTLQHEFEARDGYSYHNKIETILTGLGLPKEHYHKPLSTLSGGQRTRALLGRLLLEDPDVLLLDEPTNHLDLEAVEWLERFLQSFPRCVIVVSHDRYFLDKVATSIWEVAFGKLELYSGNYTAYTQQYAQRHLERSRQYEAQRAYVEKTEEYIRRFIAGQRSNQAKGRRTRLERFKEDEAMDRPQEHQRISVTFNPASRSGDLIFRTKGLVAGYDPHKPLVKADDTEVRRLARVAIIGGNGVGKTTLLRTLLGQIPPLAGEAQIGASLEIGYMSQTHSDLRPDATVLESLLEVADGMKPEQARAMLGSFLFSGEDAFKRISECSGGQRSRVVLARLTAVGANLLILDEPTNHLDLHSRDILQQVLSTYQGTILFVSHDRYLVQALATDIWVLQSGQLHALNGNWEAFVKWRAAHEAAAVAAKPAEPVKAPRPERNKNDDARERKRALSRLQRRHEQLEDAVQKLEAKLVDLTDKINFASARGDMDKLRELGNEYKGSNTQLQTLMDEWTKVGEELEQAQG